MFVLQERIHVRQEWPLCSRISWDHQWIMVLFWFGFDVCKPLLDWGRSRQSVFAVSSQLLTKWLEVFPWRRQETLRVITFLTRSNKGICRDGFEPKVFFMSLQGIGRPPTAASHGTVEDLLEAYLSSEWTTVWFQDWAHPISSRSYKALRIVPCPFGEADLRTLFVNETVNARETLAFCQPVIPAEAPCMAPGTDCSGQSKGPAGWQWLGWLAKACLISVLLLGMHLLERTPKVPSLGGKDFPQPHKYPKYKPTQKNKN